MCWQIWGLLSHFVYYIITIHNDLGVSESVVYPHLFNRETHHNPSEFGNRIYCIYIYIYIFKYIYLQNPQVTFFSPHANGQEFLFNSFRLDILMQNWPFGVCQWNFERGLDQPLVHASPFPPPSFQHWLNFFKRGWSETSNRGEVAMFKSQNASVSFSTMFSS